MTNTELVQIVDIMRHMHRLQGFIILWSFISNFILLYLLYRKK